MPDVAYSVTRRRGGPVSVCVPTGSNANPETGERSLGMTVYNVRLVVKEATAYGRLIKAKASQQDIGETTFIFWIRDISFRRLAVEDYIIAEGVKHQVVTSSVEDTSLVVTAREVVGDVGKQAISVNVSNDLGLTDTAVDS